MSELSKKARNRTKVQMILTMLVIVSIIRQFFLGNYHNMFLGILTLILFMVPQFIDKKLGVNDSGRIGDGDSDLYLFGRDTWRNQCILCKDSGMGYHFAYNEWIFDGSHRVCAD